MQVNKDRLLILLVGGTAKQCVDQYMVLFRCCLLAGYTAMPGGLHAIGFATHFTKNIFLVYCAINEWFQITCSVQKAFPTSLLKFE